MLNSSFHMDQINGLREKDIPALRRKYGPNDITRTSHFGRYRRLVLNTVREPMFLLLLVSSTLYFATGQRSEGWMLLAAMAMVTGISIYQETRSARALDALRVYTLTNVQVMRDGTRKSIAAVELVPDDVMVLEEGDLVPADAVILKDNDLTINESIITGESLPVDKQAGITNNLLYQGTIINSGACYARVTAIGSTTMLGKLGRQIDAFIPVNTLLQQQIRKLITGLFYFGAIAFVMICVLHYIKSGAIIQSVIIGLTLAMAAIPEEIPVAFSSFMALGAYQLAKRGIITTQPKTIENLGAVNVICLDKTGTITENNMQVKTIYVYEQDVLVDAEVPGGHAGHDVLKYAMLASEEQPFDVMEKAIHAAYKKEQAEPSPNNYRMIHEYKLQGRPPMMTHVYGSGEENTVAGKGAVEKIIQVCSLNASETIKIMQHATNMASKGYRVLGIASAVHRDGPFPATQEAFDWKFRGMVALYDPPKENIASVFRELYAAHIDIRMLTGDFPQTAMSIAEQIGMKGCHTFLTGEQIMNMTEKQLSSEVKDTRIFARMVPEAKLRVMNALKSNGEIVAMTGDGVNDGPAIKAADIGIAMGAKGTEIARRAADLILTNDNLEQVVEAIRQGRKIFNNLKKAVRYIISIHIPIILTALVPVVLNWQYATLFTPIHVIFLELIMGPTCSVFYEREPVPADMMRQPPRDRNTGLFMFSELMISIMQGLFIAAGILILYYSFMTSHHPLEKTRAVVFTTLVLSNLWLTFINRSFTVPIVTTIRYKNNLAVWVIIISIGFLSAIHGIRYIRDLFGLSILSIHEWAICAAISMVSVGWIEIYKWWPGKKNKLSDIQNISP